jgi:hypothetical protein
MPKWARKWGFLLRRYFSERPPVVQALDSISGKRKLLEGSESEASRPRSPNGDNKSARKISELETREKSDSSDTKNVGMVFFWGGLVGNDRRDYRDDYGDRK